MDLLFNHLSIHRQFHDLLSFHQALEQLIKMRNLAKDSFGREVYCNTNLVNTSPCQRLQMQQAVGQLDVNKRRAIMIWLTKGPFWDDEQERHHSGDDLLECLDKNNQVVTDTSVGEAAFRVLNGSKCGIVSIKPSDWSFSPVNVIHRDCNGQLEDPSVEIDNFYDTDTLERSLQDAQQPIASWEALERAARHQFNRLKFAEDCFKQNNFSFGKCSAGTLINLLSILNEYAKNRDEGKFKSAEAQQIYNNYFIGENARFSDSSDTEKRRFRQKLTFPHPERPGDTLFCPYHGKERHLTLRLHFSWPIQPGQPVYVVYIGPKLTKT